MAHIKKSSSHRSVASQLSARRIVPRNEIRISPRSFRSHRARSALFAIARFTVNIKSSLTKSFNAFCCGEKKEDETLTFKCLPSVLRRTWSCCVVLTSIVVFYSVPPARGEKPAAKQEPSHRHFRNL